MSQSGITDPFSFYYETDETSWLEWEFGGAPYDDEKAYEKWAPLRFAKEFATPMLLIQCGMDLRNPQGALKMDAALRRLNVPVRMIDFKNENRSIEHPVHLRALWRSIFEWIDRWLGEKNPS
jgi:acylaminoacyl-peptidase